MKKILVPVDFSEKSEDALRIAAKICKRNGAEIHVIHLIDLPSNEIDLVGGPGLGQGPYAIELMEYVHDRFDVFLDKDFLNGITVYEHVLFNKPFEGISSFANESKADMIVIGSHGTSGLDSIFVGSNTEKVVRSSKIPVLVVKASPDDFKVENFVIASKFEGKYMREFDKIMKFARIYNPKIHLLRVNTISNFLSTRELEENMNAFMKKAKLEEEVSVNFYDDYTVQEGIFHFADKVDADLIGLATRGRQGLMHFFSDSVAESVVNKAKTNILTIKVGKDD